MADKNVETAKKAAEKKAADKKPAKKATSPRLSKGL